MVGLPGALPIVLLGGHPYSWHSWLSAPFIAMSVGAAGMLVDTLILRLWRERVSRKRLGLLFAANTANMALPMAFVIYWMLTYPPQILAVLAR